MDQNPNEKRILRMPDICRKLQLGQSSIYELTKRGLFPKPFTLVPGGRAVGWIEADVDQWISDRKTACASEAS